MREIKPIRQMARAKLASLTSSQSVAAFERHAHGMYTDDGGSDVAHHCERCGGGRAAIVWRLIVLSLTRALAVF